MSSKQKTRGYRHEKWVADDLDMVRLGTMGGEDVGDLHPKIGLRFSVETKSRDDYPQWFENAHRQAWRNAPEGTLPVCMWHKTGQRHTEDRVDMRYEDWKALLAYIKELERGGPDGERPAA